MSTKIIQNEQDVLRNFGDNLRKARESAGMSIPEMSDKLGIERTSYYKYESGGRFPKLDILYAIMDTLSVDANTLLLGKSGVENRRFSNDPKFHKLLKALEVPAVYHFLMYQYLIFVANPENKAAIEKYEGSNNILERTNAGSN